MSQATDLAKEIADESGFAWCVNAIELELFFRRAQAMALRDAATRLRGVESDFLNDLADELDPPK